MSPIRYDEKADRVYTVNSHGCPTASPNEEPERCPRTPSSCPTRMEKEMGFLTDLSRAQESLNIASKAVIQVNDVMDKLKRALCYDKLDSVGKALFKRLDQLLILILDLRNRSSLQDMILPIMQYLGTLTNESISQKFMEWIYRIALTDSSGHASVEEWEPIIDNDSGDPPMRAEGGWFESNWQVLTQGKFGMKLAGIINVLIMAGLMPEKTQSKLTEETFKILQVQALRKKSPSIFHHVFTTLDWMVDSVVPAFATGNFALLFTDADEAEIDQMYINSLDMAHKNVTGQMDLVKEKYGVSDEAEMLVYIMKTSAAHMAVQKRSNGDSSYKREIVTRLIKLDKVSSDIQAYWHASGMRIKPYAVLFRGPSSVGKSTLATIAHHAICQANDFPQEKEYCCTINGSDKYQSEYRSQHICVIFDDMGNTRPEKAEGNPLFTLIQFINNMHCAALSPEAEKKGKNDIRSKIVLVTTNTEDLHAWAFSCNPTSIMRRFDLIVDVKLKPECTSASGGILPKYAGQSHPDIWNLTLSEIKIIRMGNLTDKWVANPLITNASIVELVDYLHDVTPLFYTIQQKLVDNNCELHKKEHCSKHPRFTLPCPACASAQCSDDFEPLDQSKAFITHHNLDTIKDMDAEKGVNKGRDIADSLLAEESDPMFYGEETYHDSLEIPELKDTEKLSFAKRIEFIRSTSHNALCEISAGMKKAAQEPSIQLIGGIAAVGLAAFAVIQMTKDPRLDNEGAMITRINKVAKSPRQIVERDDAYQKIYSNVKEFPKASVSTTINDLEAKIDRNLHVAIVHELNPLTGEEYAHSEWCNTFPLSGCEWIFPGHQFDHNRTYKVKFRSHPGLGIKRFDVIVDQSNTRPIPGTDGCIVHAPRGGDVANFEKYMPDSVDRDLLAEGTDIKIYHLHQHCVQDPTQYARPSDTAIRTKITKLAVVDIPEVGEYLSISYKAPTYKGLCGALIFTNCRNPVLIGMHTAGNGIDGAGILLAKDMCNATKLDRLQVAESSPMREEIYGVDTTTVEDVHGFNAVHYLSNENNFEAIGQRKMANASFKSDIIDSPVKEKLEEEFNLPKMFGAPSKKGARPSRWQHMEAATKPREHLNPSILKLASTDLRKKLSDALLSNDKFKEFVHPLSEADAMSGVPGVKGFDPLNPNTSMSDPMHGPKYKYFQQNELREKAAFEAAGIISRQYITKVDNGDGTCTHQYEIRFDPDKADVYMEDERNVTVTANGQRMNLTFRTNLKDEVQKIEKIEAGVIRVFAGAPVSMVIISRMLTLALVNAMTYYPEEFESAVGVNASGKDWEYIHDILAKNPERIGEGDFSKYDQNIRPEESYEAFDMLRYILKDCGFTDELIKIFDGFATECMFPIYESDGFVYKAFGTNPSGHPLTVIINGLINSLYMRYAYYALHQKQIWRDALTAHGHESGRVLSNPQFRLQIGDIPLFHEVIALITYGDDNLFSVDPSEELFNQTSVGTELGLVGIKYTDGSKKIATKPFIHLDDAAFLKRRFFYHPMLNARVGNLDIKSIYKSLLFCKRLKGSDTRFQAQIIGGNFSQAMSELFLHGEEVYDDHLRRFKKVLQGERDADGQLISDWFNPPTKEELVARFDSTTCAYGPAKDAINMRKESGVNDPTQVFRTLVQTSDGINLVLRLRDIADGDIWAERADRIRAIEFCVSNPVVYTDYRLTDFDTLLNEERHTGFPWYRTPSDEPFQNYLVGLINQYHDETGLVPDMNVENDALAIPPINSVGSVKFHRWCYQRNVLNHMHTWMTDCRRDDSFAYNLQLVAIEYHSVKLRMAAISGAIKFLWDSLNKSSVIPRNDWKIRNMMQKLIGQKEELNKIFLPEITSHILSFLDGPGEAYFYNGMTFVGHSTMKKTPGTLLSMMRYWEFSNDPEHIRHQATMKMELYNDYVYYDGVNAMWMLD